MRCWVLEKDKGGSKCIERRDDDLPVCCKVWEPRSVECSSLLLLINILTRHIARSIRAMMC